jgi:hypothetical protein
VSEHCAPEIIKTSRRRRRIANGDLEYIPDGREPHRAFDAQPPKILKKRVFARIGEFHSGLKRASGEAGGMCDAGAGASGLPVVSLLAHVAAGAWFEV